MRIWTFRLCAALVVLALGIGLGAGPLQHSARERDRELAAQKRATERAESRIEALRAAAAFSDAYAGATAPDLVAGRLAKRSVALLLMPGADPDLVADVRTLLAAAGATITAETTIDKALLSGESRQLVEALTSQMAEQNPSVTMAPGAAGFQRLGTLLARTLGADPGTAPTGSAYDQTAIGIASGLEAAELIAGTKVTARASLTLVIAGPAASNEREAAGNAVPTAILGAYAARTPTVLLGTTGAAGPRGLVGSVRADADVAKVVSTVDSAQTAMGRAAAVLALAARVTGAIGAFGERGDDGALPPI